MATNQTLLEAKMTTKLNCRFGVSKPKLDLEGKARSTIRRRNSVEEVDDDDDEEKEEEAMHIHGIDRLDHK